MKNEILESGNRIQVLFFENPIFLESSCHFFKKFTCIQSTFLGNTIFFRKRRKPHKSSMTNPSHPGKVIIRRDCLEEKLVQVIWPSYKILRSHCQCCSDEGHDKLVQLKRVMGAAFEKDRSGDMQKSTRYQAVE